MFNHRKDTTDIGRGTELGDRTGKIKKIIMPDEDRKGHLFCFVSTRAGKTRLIESMIEQEDKMVKCVEKNMKRNS